VFARHFSILCRNSRKSKPEEEDDDDEYSDEDSYASSDEEDRQSDASSDNEDDEEDSEGEDKLVKPVIKWNWKDIDESAYQTVDGSNRLFRISRWGNGERVLHWDTDDALTKAQRALLAKQEKSCITVDAQFGRGNRLTQVPYHEDLMPFYEYFAEAIKQRPALESFRIINHHLPPSWLESSIVSTLATFSNKHGRMATLELSNCSLSADDLSSLVKFIAKNNTLSTLNISRNDIESEDTVKDLAKAIKKHPTLCDVNLAYCKLAGGSGTLEKMLTACKRVESLDIGHEEFDSKCVAAVAKFIGKKNSLASFSLTGATIDKENKKLMSEALVKNKTIEELYFQNNKVALPGIFQTTKKGLKSLSRLTHLELTHNSLPVAGAKAMAKFLEGADCKVVTLDLSSNHLTTKGASFLLPALKKNTSLQHLDLSCNWLNDGVAPIIVDMLQNNSTLLELNLKCNKSLKTCREEQQRWSWYSGSRRTIPRRDGGRFEIVRGALFDTATFDSIAGSNHVCAVEMSGYNHGDSFEETIRKVIYDLFVFYRTL
jgi:Ran GTPase-activating protein (RanGAP) involved in mRNA processing and transport